jgi:uncharacterized protein YdeI (YjbR/CyaY-like superfamily)
MIEPPSVTMKDRAAWRSWLSENHGTMREVWLVYAKKQSGKNSITYEEAVEEAICFGWIDGQVRTIDADRYRQRFSPRTNKSRWSELNITRAKKMIDVGLMTDAGKAIFEEAMRQDRTVPALTSYSIPDELEAALASSPVALKNYQNLAKVHRLMYAGWVSTAKRPETRMKRAEKSIELLTENKRLVDVFGIKKKP